MYAGFFSFMYVIITCGGKLEKRSTYADVVSFQWKGFLGHIATRNISEYFVIAPIPFDGKKFLILQGEGTIELNIVAS